MLTVAAFLLLLGVLITVHELGHFLVAKASGVRVLTFSIGFGPKLFGFTRGETEYRVSVLPLGGYVRMYGDDINEEIPAEEQHRAFLHQPFLRKSAIAAAGPLANLLLPIALFFGMTVGTERVPEPVLGTVVPGEAAAQAGLRPGDRVVAIDGTKITLYSELQAMVEPRPGVPMRLTVERDDRTFDLTVTPRAAPSPTLFDAKRTVGRLGVISAVELPVVTVDPGSAAAGAGVRDLDRIVSVDGTAVGSKEALLAALDRAGDTVKLDVVTPAREEGGQKLPEERRTVTVTRVSAAPDSPAGPVHGDVALDRFGVTSDELAAEAVSTRIAATRAAVAEAQAAMTRRFGLAPVAGRVAHVEPGTVAAEKQLEVGRDRVVAVNGKPLLTPGDLETALRADPDGVHVIGVVRAAEAGEESRVLVFRMLPAPQRHLSGIKVFGVALTSAFGDGAMVERSVSPSEALRRAVTETGDVVVDVFRGFGMLFSGDVGLESLGGPITIAKMSGQAAEQSGEDFVRLMAAISVNLGIINLLPIPVLDGGHLLMFLIELVTRRRLSAETRMKVTKVGLAIVGLLMIVAIGNDVIGLF